MRRRFRFQPVLYYILLFCLFNIHLIAMILACSLHVYHLLLQRERQQKKLYLLIEVLLGGLFLGMALWSIYPPADSTLHVDFQDSTHTLAFGPFVYSPLRSFLPMPAWWKYNFWNTQFLLDAGKMHGLLPFVSLVVVASVFFVLWPNRKCLALFGTNLLLSGIVSITSFTLGSARHSGFLFIGAFAALWLFCYEMPLRAGKKQLILVLLSFQAVAALFVIWQTIRYPFSLLSQIGPLTAEVPAGRQLVTDYWTMNAYAAFMDRPIYCIDLQKERSFVMWNSDMAAVLKDPYRYCNGLSHLFQKEGIHEVYMISMSRAELLTDVDAKLLSEFRVELIDKREGAIEKGSNLYLYKIAEKYGVLNHP
jgi:hypothetical protein